MKTVYFKEEQRVTSKWIWLLVSCLTAVYFYSLVELIFFDNKTINNPEQDWIFIFFGIIPLILFLLLIKVKLVVVLDDEGCKFRFYPFHLKERVIRWEEIKKIHLRKYNPIFEYGGWGIRVLPFSKNIAFNIKGNYGIQIELKNEKKILLGTSESVEIEKVLKQINIS